MQEISIGEAARHSGVKPPTIRYYEQIGLLPAPPRSEGNRRLYDATDLRRLAFIRHARELGFEIDAIRALLSLQDARTNPAPPPTKLPAPGSRRLSIACPAWQRSRPSLSG